ncbi:MAG: hypothetical protein IT214_12085 [Chitinophagaceae bacterium]|nr:hypothetical protein [Chitinophagaceae bacterium]
MKLFIHFFLVSILSFSIIPASAKFYFQPQEQDTTIDMLDDLGVFFSGCDTVANQAKTTLIMKNGKTVSLENIFRSEGDDLSGIGKQYGLKDLDGDGTKELVLFNYTGGAHCCDELYVFKYVSPGKYRYAVKTFAGDVNITPQNEFVYHFYEQYGYFFTCFACGYEDSSDTAPLPVHSILLRYDKGRLKVIPGDTELKNTINDNLGKLREQPYQKVTGGDDIDFDNGLRKEFALNLAVYYFSFGKNINSTKAVFDKYYTFPDAKEVWKEFREILKGIESDNDF